MPLGRWSPRRNVAFVAGPQCLNLAQRDEKRRLIGEWNADRSCFVLAKATPTRISSFVWLDALHRMKVIALRAVPPHARRAAVGAVSAATAAIGLPLTRPTPRPT